MPKTNRRFWLEKFAENVRRDRRALRVLARQGWRTRVVWECELVRAASATVPEVAKWIRKSASGAPRRSNALDPPTLLRRANENVRRRIASYTNDRR